MWVCRGDLRPLLSLWLRLWGLDWFWRGWRQIQRTLNPTAWKGNWQNYAERKKKTTMF